MSQRAELHVQLPEMFGYTTTNINILFNNMPLQWIPPDHGSDHGSEVFDSVY